MERGYVKLWRKTLDSGLLQNDNAFRLFGYLLLNVAYAEKKVANDGCVSVLHPGQAIFSRKRVAQILNMSEQNARTALNFLKKLEILTTKVTNKFTVVSFVNWHIYQQQDMYCQPAKKPTVNQQLTNTSPTLNQQLTTVLEGKKERKKEEIHIGGQAATSQISLFDSGSGEGDEDKFVKPTVEEVRSYCAEKGYHIDEELFVAHYESKGWKVGKSPMKSWKSAITTWRKNNFSTQDTQNDCPLECPHEAIREVWDGIFTERKSYGWTKEARNNLTRTWNERYADRKWQTVDDGITYFRDAWNFVYQYCQYGLWRKKDGSSFLPSFDWAVCSENFITMLNAAREKREVA